MEPRSEHGTSPGETGLESESNQHAKKISSILQPLGKIVQKFLSSRNYKSGICRGESNDLAAHCLVAKKRHFGTPKKRCELNNLPAESAADYSSAQRA